jgi:hypothetical protein
LIGRRALPKATAAPGIAALVPTDPLRGGAGLASVNNGSSKPLRVWVFSGAHVSRDKQYGNGVQRLARVLRQSESASSFAWDIALDLGDLCEDLGLSEDKEGAEIIRGEKRLANAFRGPTRGLDRVLR